jgi:hypothetical protein
LKNIRIYNDETSCTEWYRGVSKPEDMSMFEVARLAFRDALVQMESWDEAKIEEYLTDLLYDFGDERIGDGTCDTCGHTPSITTWEISSQTDGRPMWEEV